MKTSVTWINDYLDRPASADEQAELLTRAGFPMETREEVDGETWQEIETTSNRGDCVCHVGLAREIAAISQRGLKAPAVREAMKPGSLRGFVLENREPGMCPLYTARIIRGVKVGPSPAWMAKRLRAIGQIPRNAIVDASNFVLFELGQPTHVFDLAKLKGPAIHVRRAHEGEAFLPIGEGAAAVKLTANDLVIADAERAAAIAGVKGGALTAVSDGTRDILIEAATFDPVAVRGASRRHGITSDSCYRFERGVHPGQMFAAAERLADLIVECCGGEREAGYAAAGGPMPSPRRVTMRTERARKLLGFPVADSAMVDWLARLGFQPQLDGSGVIACTVPVERLDIEREVDLIEEVCRMHGMDGIAVRDVIELRVAPPQPTELARQAVHDALAGMGFVETVTHSLVSDGSAEAFLPPGMQTLRVDDDRAKAEPALRPSVLCSLLRVYAHNRDRGVHGVRLFESAAAFAQMNGRSIETNNLALLMPMADANEGIRPLRGVIDRVVQLVFGRAAKIEVEATNQLPWLSAGAAMRVNGEMLGTFGVLAKGTLGVFGLSEPLMAAEIGLPGHYHRYPPDAAASALPAFPPIERDVSAIVNESVSWERILAVVERLKLEQLDAVEFVTSFRGKSIGAGRKSVTLRLRFRAADRTLRHEEVDDRIQRVISELRSETGAEIRS